MTESEKLDLILVKLEKMDTLESKIDALDTRVGALESKIDSLEIEFAVLREKMCILEESVASLDEVVARLEESAVELRECVVRLEDRTARLEQDAAGIKLILENEIRTNIMRVAEGHQDLYRNFKEATKMDAEKEMISIRVGVLESELRKVKERLEQIA